MLFSFILPAYKKKYLKTSIDSILAQTFSDFELIIVNDASPENLEEIINKYTDNRIKYYKNEVNIGKLSLVKQWNKCLSLATGEYVILASDDDLYLPNFLDVFNNLINKYPNVNVFRARTLDIDNNDNIIGVDKQFNEFIDTDEFRYIWFTGIKGGIANCIFKRQSLLNVNGFVDFPLAWGSDHATILLLSNNGFVSSKEHLFCFRWSGVNISSLKNHYYQLEKFKARMKLCEWQQQFLQIEANTPTKNFYQKEIYRIHTKQTYDYVLWSIIGMNFRTFLTSIKELKHYKLIRKKDKYKILIYKLFYHIKSKISRLLRG